MAKKQFKAESKRVLDLMINSIYTHKEIFLREIISNASDACDKLCYQALTDDSVGLNRKDFKIELKVDKENRLITVSDNGIGMDKEDLENNLGVIASSGSYKFKQEVGDDAKDTDVIGQFGVGFYSAFMVADHITVVTKKYGSDTAYMWQSAGADGYTITECEKDTVGTDIIMHVKPDTDDEKYSEFLESWRLQELVRKYSDYIRFPIRMEVSKTRKKEGCPDDKPEYETYQEIETLNSMVPIWQRRKANVKPEEYNKFYRDKFHDYTDPQRVIAVSAEGAVTYKALLFIPGATPYDYYTKEYEKGLQLYSNGVLIMDKCADLLPEHFRFVRGVVDSPDLSLNISRELLQHDRQLKVISNNLTKKVKGELKKLMESDRKKYEEFYKAFGYQLKYSTVSAVADMREQVRDLLLFQTGPDRMCSLQEYVDNMPESQEKIYYVCADNLKLAMAMPQTEVVKQKGYEVFYLTDPVDEFVFQALDAQDGKPFQNVSKGDLDLVSEEEKQETEQAAEEGKDLLDFIKETLGDQVVDVRLSTTLVSHPVCLNSQGTVTLEMERYFRSIPGDDGSIRAARVLEINPRHPLYAKLQEAFATDKDRCADMARVLYAQASLIAGMPLDDPAEYTELVCNLL